METSRTSGQRGKARTPTRFLIRQLKPGEKPSMSEAEAKQLVELMRRDLQSQSSQMPENKPG